jgi:hypothetical protein
MAFCLAAALFLATALHANQKNHSTTTGITSSPRGDVVIGSVGGVGQTIASDPFVTLLAGVSLALRNR